VLQSHSISLQEKQPNLIAKLLARQVDSHDGISDLTDQLYADYAIDLEGLQSLHLRIHYFQLFSHED